MSDDTVIAPAPAGEMSDADAATAFEALAAARFDPTDDPTPVATPDEPVVPADTDPAPAAPAAVDPAPATPAAPAPAAAATDIWSSATPEVRAAHEAELARERQRYNSDLGRQAAYQRKIADLESRIAAGASPAAPTAAPAATPVSLREQAAIKKSLEDYPEVVGPILDALEPLVADNARLGRDVSTLTEDRRAAELRANEQELTRRHPDWSAACGSPEFADWLAVQPPSVKRTIEENGKHIVNAEEAATVVTNFKAHYALTHPATPPVVATPAHAAPTPAVPTNLAARREAQLSAVAAAPKGGPTGIPDGAPGGEAKAVFDSFVQRKAKKG